VKNDWLVFFLQVFEAFNDRGEVMSIDGAVITKSKFFKKDIGDEHVFSIALDFVSKFTGIWACHFFDDVSSSFADPVVGRVGLQGVKVFREGADIFVDRPFVVVEDDNTTLRSFGDVVEGL